MREAKHVVGVNTWIWKRNYPNSRVNCISTDLRDFVEIFSNPRERERENFGKI